MKLNKWSRICALVGALALAPQPVARAAAMGIPGQPAQQEKEKDAGLKSASSRDQRRATNLAEEVRHQLVTLPYYSVFDWVEANVSSNGEVTLSGEVVRPTVKSDAEARLKNLESVSGLVNKINLLPISPNDDQLRIALYRSIFKFESPLFRYGTAAVPSIHIIVYNGHVRLRGVVASKEDAQLAYMAANGVAGVFEVQNELQVEKSAESN